MATSTRKRPATARARAKKARPPAPPPSIGWWGNGVAPHVRWPGVTIEIHAVWVPLIGHYTELVNDGEQDYVVWKKADGTEIESWWGAAGGRWQTEDGRYYFDAAEAQRACDFFPAYLRHHIGEFAGDPFTLLDYQQLLLTKPLFGWKHADTGLRRFRKVFAFLPKGAGKSPWGAGTGLYLTLCDNEPAAEVYAVAGDREQARTVHEGAKIMVEEAAKYAESADLAEMCEVLKDSIYCAETRSTYKVLSSDAATKHGFRPHCVIFDEFHAQRNRDLYEALKKSMVKRRQPVMVLMSHSGDDDEGICFEEYEYAKGVLSGTVPDDTCLPVIFEASPDDDWTSPAVWRRVNPGHGITVHTTGIAAECEEAKAEPRKLNDFLRFHLNRWVNQATAWIPTDWWDKCDQRVPSDAELREWPCAAGIDMAQKIDLAGGVVLFKLPLDEVAATDETEIEVLAEGEDGAVIKRTLSLDYQIAIIPAAWLPEETLRERAQQDRIPYPLWNEQKFLNVVPGAIIGADPIVRYFAGVKGTSDHGLLDRFPRLKGAEFAYDPAFATDVALGLRDVHNLTTVEVPQNYTHLSEACQVLEALIKAKRVRHVGQDGRVNKLLRSHLENVAIKKDDAGRIRPVKPKKSTKRIDLIVAILIALTRLMAVPLKKRSGKKRMPRVWTPNGWKDVVTSTTDHRGDHAHPPA